MRSVQAWPRLEGVLALAEGSSRTIASVLAPDVQAWLASPEQGLAAEIESEYGAVGASEALARLAPSSLKVVATVLSDDACWAEIIRRGVGEPETCIVGLTYGADGTVSRLVWLRAPLVPASEIDDGTLARDEGQANEETAAPDGRPVLDRYFADLMSSEFRKAATHFTADTIYSHPPYAGGTERILFRGREAVWRGWVKERGPSPVRQVITALWQQGGRVFVEGVIEGIPDGGSFFSTAQITPEGEIARYVAFYSGTRIPSVR
jgi:hypothetical protein